ncbi:MAG: sensor histidine kinase, partial [Pseudomonas stutzeri]|nr:sensor histidine kinase [Stutzerimonas stutzeri]
LPQDGPIGEDIDLLISQAERCRQILSRLADRDAQSDAMFARLKLPVMLEEIIDPLRGPDIDIVVVTKAASDANGEPLPAPVIPRNPAIKYGVANLLENAVDFARSTVNVELAWSNEEISVSLSDDGPGFSQQVIDRLGDPFVTTRPGYGADAEVTS